MKINPPSASFFAVQKELEHVYEISSDRERHNIAFVMALLTKACGDASVTTIADNPSVVAAVAALLAAVTEHLKVRVDGEKVGFLLGLLLTRPAFNRTSEAVDKAKNALNDAMHEAWIKAVGRDPRNDDAYHVEFCALTSLQLEFNKRLHELSVDILQQTVSFAASIAEELDELIESSPECQPGRSASFYPRIFALGPQKSSWTHIDQFTLALGALSFFLYAVDWLLHKRNDEVLRAAILDPLADSLCKVLADVRNQMNDGKQALSKNATHDIIAELHQRYAEAPALVGKDPQDRNSGVWLAAYSITESINNKAEIFGTVIATEFLKCLTALDLPKRIDALCPLNS